MTRPSASIVIPAHNEAGVIAATLTRLLADAEPGEFEVVVACNGTTDRTASIAASFPGVRVIETPVASKIAALNLGDQAASVFPRVYLDADIEVDAASIRAVVAALEAGAPAAAPSAHVDLDGTSVLARAYFSVWRHLGYVRHHLVGSGVYALSETGRARFAEFPDVIADDLFVYCQFSDAERVNPEGARFRIRVPRTLKATLARRIRIVRGNLELAEKTGLRATPPRPNPLDVARHRPWLIPATALYLLVNNVALRKARAAQSAGAATSWNRDESRREHRHGA